MLGRRKWFDTGSKYMVQCWIEGDGSMLGLRICSFVGFQTGNWMPKTNLAGKKKTDMAGAKKMAGKKNWRPDKNQFGGNKELTLQHKLSCWEYIL